MNDEFAGFLRQAVPGGDQIPGGDEPWPSLVLLLRVPREFTHADANQLARQVWNTSQDKPEIVGSPRDGSYVIHVSGLFFAMHSVAARYSARGHEADVVRQQVWDQHSAWLSIDYSRGSREPRSKWGHFYFPLTLMANKVWDANVLGAFFPAEGVTVPNMGELIPSITWAAKNGSPLQFLKRN
ncbi:MAG TPA: hypothetical protein VIY53_20780 [Acidobacteriaceae bacterium]